jgi:hypothetical protein
LSRSAKTFKIEKDIVEDISHRRLVRYFGKSDSIEVLNSFEMIGEFSFSGCESLRSVTFQIGWRLLVIEKFGFARSTVGKIVVIPRSVKVLSQSCFSFCKYVESVTFESGSELERIEAEAFRSTKLKAIVIPASVEVIARRAFGSCLSLKSVTFEPGSRLRDLDSDAFDFCPCLSVIVLPQSSICEVQWGASGLMNLIHTVFKSLLLCCRSESTTDEAYDLCFVISKYRENWKRNEPFSRRTEQMLGQTRDID